jgi:hypothetical protein
MRRMKILVLDSLGSIEVVDSEFLPRVGDKVDMFYEPLPTVTSVVVWPTKKRLKQIKADNLNIKAIITVR